MNQAVPIPGSGGYLRLAPRLGTAWRIAGHNRGLGDLTNSQIAQRVGGSVGGTILAIAPLTGPIAAPFVAAAGAAVELAGVIAGMFQGCGQTCVQATTIVNQAEPYMRQNLAAFQAGPQTLSAQLQSLANFDAVWASIQQGCGNPALGDAGVRCLSERGPNGSLPGYPGVNWYTLYRDPIADAEVVDDSSSFSSLIGGTGASNNIPALLALGLVAWLLL